MAPRNDDEKKARGLNLDMLGFSGLKQFGGIIDEEWHPKLRGEYGPKVYREMADNSSTVGAIRYIIRSLVRQVDWRVEPASSEQAAVDWAEFLESCLIDMSITFEDLISEVLSMLDYGWAYFELVYKLRKGMQAKTTTTLSQFDDGKVGWRTIALRAQDTLERWQFSEENDELEGMHQQTDAGQSAFIPVSKAVLFRTETYKDNPLGRSIYRNAVNDYFYLKRISEIEAIGIERDMTGLLTMEVPIEMLQANAKPAAKALRADIEKMLSQLKRDEREYAMVPPEVGPDGKPTGYKLKLLSTGGARQIDTNATKSYYKKNILQTVLAQFIELGMGSVGSFALSSNQTNMFATALGAHLDNITATFNRYAVSKLMLLNNVEREIWPSLVHGDVEGPPLDEVGAYVQALAAAGQLPEDDAIKRKLLEIGNLPMPEQEEGREQVTKSREPGGLVCKFHRRQGGRLKKAVPGAVPARRPPAVYCPYCGKPIIGDHRKCPHCGKVIPLFT